MNLKKIREGDNITQTELAELIGVHQQTISRWETGRVMPQTQSLIKLAHILGGSVFEIAGVFPQQARRTQFGRIISLRKGLLFLDWNKLVKAAVLPRRRLREISMGKGLKMNQKELEYLARGLRIDPAKLGRWYREAEGQ